MTVNINNDGSLPLNNIYIEITGIPETSFSINPAKLTTLGPGSSSYFLLSILPQNITPNTYTITVRFFSDEASNVTSFLLNVKPTPTDTDGNNNGGENKPVIGWIIILLIVVIIVSISILVAMFVLFKAKRCPLCGAELVKDYEGANYVSYKCNKCKYYSYKIKKKT